MKGKVWKYGDNINTDVIFPGKYTYSPQTPEEMAQHALEDLDPNFASKVRQGDIIVGGKNFGCGSSREQAAICLKAAGVQAVIAKSFARIFFRNAINQGLLVFVDEDLVDHLSQGEEVELDFEKGVLESRGARFRLPALPEMVVEIIRAGGLIPYTKKKLSRQKK
ncbi:MAG: 3-isopropylmalate dehydratase [Candidatus Aminicenantes bacterium 4484_214]|nr:MAG: 3-isopropylmalate dehydratase [Candidatus Aminicenantes bacterium 4484_214]RLE06927.1 MAG: 3-isopropylmalate dehydratase [Candidatus Aminicenantes bacterium]HDJ24050.1 3-isopropylmalate dehydratase small subunit [Candidatus Aminicenantes bacterium]